MRSGKIGIRRPVNFGKAANSHWCADASGLNGGSMHSDTVLTCLRCSSYFPLVVLVLEQYAKYVARAAF